MSHDQTTASELRVGMSEESLRRFEDMQRIAGASATEIVQDAFRMYEEALRLARASEERDGVVYLGVKYPDGTSEEKPLFS